MARSVLHRSRWFFLALALLCLVACDDQDVQVDRDSTIPIPAGSTWAWNNIPPASATLAKTAPMIDNDIVHNRIQNAIAAQLEAKGLRRVDDAGKADFLVDYHMGVHEAQTTVQNLRQPGPRPVPVIQCGQKNCWQTWYWGYWGPPEVSYHNVKYREGSLMIDLVQRSSGKLAWRAISQSPVTPDSYSDQQVNDGIAGMLKKLAPTA